MRSIVFLLNIMDQITELLTRGVKHCIVKEDLEKKLRVGKELRIKFGIDPTGSQIHLGNAVPIWGLRRFQDLGHKIVFIVGDFTGQIGDTSDKDAMRTQLTREQVEENMKDWKNQVSKILDLKKIEFCYNSKWLNKLTFADVANLASKFTVAQMIERENYKLRFESGKPIGLHEFMYPLMQGYDSVAVKSDVELGGDDQLFNNLAGRTMQEAYGQEPQNVLTFELIEGTDGRKMSKSYGNVINITDEPKEMFGKAMRITDELIVKYFTVCTPFVSMEEVEAVKQSLKNGDNPRDAKMRLAYELVKMYHSEEAAEHEKQEFINVFSNNELPSDIPEISLKVENIGLIDLIAGQDMASSKSEARRLIQGGGVSLDGEKVSDIETMVGLTEKPLLLKVGKRKYLYVKK